MSLIAHQIVMADWLSGWSNRQLLALALGIICAAIAIGLIVASWTRWGQNKAITNCVVLAVLAHIGLLMYAAGTRVAAHRVGDGTAADGPMRVHLIDSAASVASPPATQAEPTDEIKSWEQPDSNSIGDEWIESVSGLPPEDQFDDLAAAELLDDLAAIDPLDSRTIENSTDELPLVEPIKLPQKVPDPAVAVEKARNLDADKLDEFDESKANSESMASTEGIQNGSIPPKRPPENLTPSVLPAPPTIQEKLTHTVSQPFPQEYQLRLSNNRAQLLARYGGDASTEQSVKAALVWLARNQSEDGFWDAERHGAGIDRRPLGEGRGSSGRRANTAMTGLALLAFLGAGHTHQSGEYRDTVARGLDYLIQSQLPSGDLSGVEQMGNEPSVRYARMYSHGIAGLAICEAFGLSRDQRLKQSAVRAAEYTLAMQNPKTGGWRYGLRGRSDPGDLSQFGWQAMLLKSAESAGIKLPGNNRLLLNRFLNSVTDGRFGGLATYQPRRPGSATAAMTAEALACRLLLNQTLAENATNEAKAMLLKNLPGRSEENLYYWYYATLAMFQYQDTDWRTWNESLKTTLINSQITDGSPQDGSWNPSGLWGGYGGRVYSTAMGCMCLEVYYRYLPMYQSVKSARRPR